VPVRSGIPCWMPLLTTPPPLGFFCPARYCLVCLPVIALLLRSDEYGRYFTLNLVIVLVSSLAAIRDNPN
jgi:hypothetical protein